VATSQIAFLKNIGNNGKSRYLPNKEPEV